MTADQTLSPAPLFDRTTDGRSFVPTKACQAGARSGGQGWPLGRRDSALPLTAASTTARFRLIGTGLLILSLSLTPGPADAQDRRPAAADPLSVLVSEAAVRFGIPETWIRSVMRVESAFDPRALSSAGAMGLMQVMPQTYAELRVRYGLGADPYLPRDNIMAGAAYLREMYDRFGAGGFLAAYNAGPARYEQFLAGRALPQETRLYVAKLNPLVAGLAPQSPSSSVTIAPIPTLFAPIGGQLNDAGTVAAPAPPRPVDPAAASIFATLSARVAGR